MNVLSRSANAVFMITDMTFLCIVFMFMFVIALDCMVLIGINAFSGTILSGFGDMTELETFDLGKSARQTRFAI